MTVSNNAEYLKKLRAEAAARGDCYICRCRPATEGRRNCQHCIDLARIKAREMYATNPKKGLCTLCNRPRVRGIRTCEMHREAARARNSSRYYEAVASGRCGSCKKPDASSNALCRACLDRVRVDLDALTARRRAAAKCSCGRRPQPGYVTCKRCLVAQKEASRRWLERKRAAAAVVS